MKLFLLILGNALVLLALGRWLRAQSRLPGLGRWLWPTLVLKLSASIVSSARPSEDAWYYNVLSRDMTAQLWAAPGQWWHMLGADEFHFGSVNLVFHGYSNTFFFLKVCSALNVLSAGSLLVTALYLSVACFVACWALVRVLSQLFPTTQAAAIGGVLLWPSVVFWSSGITKESLLLAGCATMTAAALMLLYGRPPGRAVWLVAGLFGTWLSFKMRFFYGGALLALLLCLAVVEAGARFCPPLRRRGWQVAVFTGLLVGGAELAAEISPVFRFNKFASQLTRTYAELHEKSAGRPHIDLPALAPTRTSILLHTPKAVASTLLRPYVWESASVRYVFAALENMLLLLLLLAAAADQVRGRRPPLPFAVGLALGLYSLLMAALIGLSTPNLGTLNRYRAPWLALLLYLLLSHPTIARRLPPQRPLRRSLPEALGA